MDHTFGGLPRFRFTSAECLSGADFLLLDPFGRPAFLFPPELLTAKQEQEFEDCELLLITKLACACPISPHHICKLLMFYLEKLSSFNSAEPTEQTKHVGNSFFDVTSACVQFVKIFILV